MATIPHIKAAPGNREQLHKWTVTSSLNQPTFWISFYIQGLNRMRRARIMAEARLKDFGGQLICALDGFDYFVRTASQQGGAQVEIFLCRLHA
jgi:hypothetical protein